jgi:hypothetical protein
VAEGGMMARRSKNELVIKRDARIDLGELERQATPYDHTLVSTAVRELRRPCNEKTSSWPDQLTRCRALTSIAILFLGSDSRMIRAAADCMRHELICLENIYKHERNEDLATMVSQIVDLLWERIQPFVDASKLQEAEKLVGELKTVFYQEMGQK